MYVLYGNSDQNSPFFIFILDPKNTLNFHFFQRLFERLELMTLKMFKKVYFGIHIGPLANPKTATNMLGGRCELGYCSLTLRDDH